MQDKQNFCPNKISSYFRAEWLSLTFVTLSGLFYNVGLLATPWFEGRLAQCLTDILGGYQTADAMAMLVLAYLVITLVVQGARFIKRFYVRRFANNINRRMKGISVRQSGTRKPHVAGERRCWRADDESHFRRGRLRGGNAKIHHRSV